QSDAGGSVPSNIQAQLTWNNGTPQSAVTFSTTGHSAGDDYLLDTQVSSAVGSTGNYPWSVQLTATLTGGNIVRTSSGNSLVTANGASDAFGYGWSLAGLDSLVSDSNGVMWVSGSGGARYFQKGPSTTYISPANDFGTLVKNGDGSFTYTAKDQSKENF